MSSELAAWVQAIGSILAVGGAAFAAIYQSKKQHESALKLQKEDRRYARVELTKSLLQLTRNGEAICRHFIRTLNSDRTNVHDIAEGRKHLDFGELARAENALSAVPLHNLPAKLVTYTMWAHSTVRQFREKIESALRHHREMQSEHFNDLFRTTTEMCESLSKTVKDIETEALHWHASGARRHSPLAVSRPKTDVGSALKIRRPQGHKSSILSAGCDVSLIGIKEPGMIGVMEPVLGE